MTILLNKNQGQGQEITESLHARYEFWGSLSIIVQKLCPGV